MARYFDSSLSERITRSSNLTTASQNISFGAWIRLPSTSGTRCIMYNGFGGSAGGGYGLRIANTTNRVNLDISFVAAINGTSSLSTATWHHVFITRDTTTWRVYVNGVQENTGTANPYGHTSPFGIGARRTNDGSWDNHFTGDIAEVCFFLRELSSDEVSALAKGFSPLFFPRNCIMYKPILGSSPEIDFFDSGSWTITGTTKSEHPKIIYPSGCIIPRKPGTVQIRQYLTTLGIGS